MRAIIFGLACLLFSVGLNARSRDTLGRERGSNIVYVEAGGVLAYYSLNYQHNFRLSRSFALAAGVALGPVVTINDPTWSPRIGFQTQVLYTKGAHEIGLGAATCSYTYIRQRTADNDSKYERVQTAILGQLGYSYTTLRGIYLGAYFTPVLFDTDLFDFIPWAGLRVGYRL